MLSPAKRFGKLRLFAVPLLAASALALFAACGGNPDMISRQEAEQIALEQMPQAELSELDLTTDKGLALYEGTLQQDDKEYNFEIDAETGLVLNMAEAGAESAAEQAGKTQSSETAGAAVQSASGEGEIGADAAQAIILEIEPQFTIDTCFKTEYEGKAAYQCDGTVGGEAQQLYNRRGFPAAVLAEQ